MADNTWEHPVAMAIPKGVTSKSRTGPLRPHPSAYPGLLWLHHHRQNYSGKRVKVFYEYSKLETRNGSVRTTRLSGYPQAPLPANGCSFLSKGETYWHVSGHLWPPTSNQVHRRCSQSVHKSGIQHRLENLGRLSGGPGRRTSSARLHPVRSRLSIPKASSSTASIRSAALTRSRKRAANQGSLSSDMLFDQMQ